ncbi:MAG: uL30 family ribosomal protein [Clostridia bacterium]|nr:uL30 family ribosomal protein [Clostridia bacterium]
MAETTKTATKTTATKTTAAKTTTAKPVAKTAVAKATPVKATAEKKVAKVATVKPVAKNVEKKVNKPVANGKIRVTMIHGLASCTQRQIRTAKALKLSRPGDTRELPNLPSILGACKKLEHLVKVENI